MFYESFTLKNLDHVDHDYQVVSGNPEVCRHWLPWVHKFISNAKTWINGPIMACLISIYHAALENTRIGLTAVMTSVACFIGR